MAEETVRNIAQLHRRLRALRLTEGVSMAALARGAGISRSTLYQYENSAEANPTLDNLLRLAAFFRLHSLEELFGPLPSSDLGAMAAEHRGDQAAG